MDRETEKAEQNAKRAVALREAHLARAAAKEGSKELFRVERKLRDEFERMMRERNKELSDSVPWWCRHFEAQGLFRAAEMVCEARKRRA